VKLVRLFLLGLFCALASTASAQLTIGTVDPGPYTPGSSIAATFTISAASCITQGNVFTLQLSNAAGSFAAPVNIGTYTSFYSAFVNGVIPPATPIGVGYRVRVVSSTPAFTSAPSAPFIIKAGSVATPDISSVPINSTTPETFGLCSGRNNNSFALTNESDATAVVTATVTNELTGAPQAPLIFATPIQTFTAGLAHYTVFAKAVMPDGSVGTRAYFIINNQTNTAFSTSGNNVVCLPIGALEFNVIYTGATGIQNNFPGDTYLINWGDQSISTYTLCDIIQAGGKVSHYYTLSSCGNVFSGSSGTEYNVFAVNVSVENSFCGRVGSTISTTAKVITQPINRYNSVANACTNSIVTFENTSLQGDNPNTNTAGCTPNNVLYNWYVDGVLRAANRPLTYNFQYTFTTNGNHTVTLESISSGLCDGDPFTTTICVQNAPIPAFAFAPNKVCGPATLTPTNTSIIDGVCNPAYNYTWHISPGVTYANGTDANSATPDIIFTNPGIYTVILSITTPSCGTRDTTPQYIYVDATPTATLSADVTLCNIGIYDFNPTTPGPTRTLFAGTSLDESDTYTWTITGGAYNFGTGDLHTKYPRIEFLDFATYTITAVHKNSCGTVSDSQEISFIPAPIVNAGSDFNICYNDLNVTLNGSVTGAAIVTRSWVGGSGIFTPDRDTLNATYEPTTAERNAGQVILTLRTTTSLPVPCNVIEDYVTIDIKPLVTVTSANAKSICTGTAVGYTATSATAGATFAWTATGSANATGFTASGNTAAINDVITNTDATTNATVTYTITPSGNGCVGPPFTFTVTITPNPIVTATAANSTICSQQNAGITLSSNLTNTSYTWTSTVTGSVTGNSNNPTPTLTTTINDQLFNAGTTTGTVTYTITPVSSNSCPGASTQVTINIEPQPTTPNAGIDQRLCNVTTATLVGNVATPNTGLWSLTSGQAGVTFIDATNPNTIVNGLVPGQTYTFRWTITGLTPCLPLSDDVNIIVDLPSNGGTTAGSAPVCAGNNSGNITLSGQVGSIVEWQSSTDGFATFSTIASTSASIPYLNLTTTTQYRAIIKNGICGNAFSTVSTITVNQGAVSANAGIDQTLCNLTSTTLAGNDPSPNVGLWTLTSGPAGSTITNPSLYNTTVTGLVGGTYIFTWTISGVAPCGATNDNMSVVNLPPIQNNSITTPITTNCSGQAITLTGSTPTGGNGTYIYAWESSPTGAAPWTAINGQTARDLNITVTSSLSYRRIVTSGVCATSSNILSITALPPIATNTIAPNQTICLTQTPATITGSQPTGGDGTNYTYGWEQSTDGVVWTAIIGANGQNYSPPAITQTTQYRRLVSSGVCTGAQQSVSAAVTITVNLNARAQFTYTNDIGCVPFVLDATNIQAVPYPSQNNTYTWFADGVQIGTGITFPGYTINTYNANVIIRLVVTSSNGCLPDEMSHTFTTRENIVASFSQSVTEGCGPLTVNFTNTTPVAPGTTYEWSIDGTVVSTATDLGSRVFATDPAGFDKIYTIDLKVVSTCGTNNISHTVTVKADPVPAISAVRDNGCSDFDAEFINTSPGRGTNTYIVDFGDGSAPQSFVYGDPIRHRYTTTVVRDYAITMTATNQCNSITSDPIFIRVSPNAIIPIFFAPPNQQTVCVGTDVSFRNNTAGASRFVYDFKDGTSPVIHPTSLPETITHRFLIPGTFDVSMVATNECPATNSAIQRIVVLAAPTATFNANITTGCEGLSVAFTQTNTDAVSYLWDFGDGATSTDANPTHAYNVAPGQYSVSLTVINDLGCPFTVTRSNYITIVGPPTPAFAISPAAIISIPDYTFKFTNESTNGAETYRWSFGDGDISTQRDPIHTYADTGRYLVTLRAYNVYGCVDSVQNFVQIVGIPGYTFVPNAFIPGSTSIPLQKFMGIGSGMKSWKMSIFNKWGQVLWETTKLEDGKPVEGWDGTYKGVPQPQGIYFWKIEVELLNGSEWKGMSLGNAPPRRTGQIYLIR
jgi:PKD repeat protein